MIKKYAYNAPAVTMDDAQKIADFVGTGPGRRRAPYDMKLDALKAVSESAGIVDYPRYLEQVSR